MATVEEIAREIADPTLRERLEQALAEFKRRAPYGLVFERHTPEILPLPGMRLRPGTKVAPRRAPTTAWLTVRNIIGGTVEVESQAGQVEHVAIQDVIPVKRHGEPVFPCLDLVDALRRNPGSADHVLIEAENFSALQLLRWLYRGRADCIYIDPPYNTGAKDWKYNNNYVDKSDSFRSSKWLSMMERRLEIARDLLAPDGVLVVAIDDHEFAHLSVLLDRSGLFRGWEIQPVVVQHNPRGGGGNLISNTHEYAVFVVPPGRSLDPIDSGVDEIRDYRRRGRGDNNFRYGRPNSFFAFHVHPETFEVVGVGPKLEKDEPYETGPTPEGHLRIYPFTRKGSEERVWRNSREKVIEKLENGKLVLRCTPNHTIVQFIAGEKKNVPIRSVWTGPRYNAGERGTNLVAEITGVQFPYPKSLYTVYDCLKAVVGKRKGALVVDFFAGSGTTLHALALMNSVDGGHRRSILVTNNEVSVDDARRLTREGLQPGQEEWEEHGICRSITFPRCRNTISGLRHDGQSINYGYETGEEDVTEESPEIVPLVFTTPEVMSDPAARKAIASFLGFTQASLRSEAGWFIPPAGEDADLAEAAAIIWDPSKVEEFLDAMGEDDGEQVAKVFVVPPLGRRRDVARFVAKLADGIEPRRIRRKKMRPAGDGFPANLSYFRLRFLDPDDVEVGARFRDLLPSIWLMAGARGPIPEIEPNAAFLVRPELSFAVLLKEMSFHEFRTALAACPDVGWVFLVADSRESFNEMSRLLPARIPATQRVQLHREYTDNFRINGGRE